MNNEHYNYFVIKKEKEILYFSQLYLSTRLVLHIQYNRLYRNSHFETKKKVRLASPLSQDHQTDYITKRTGYLTISMLHSFFLKN